MTVDVRSRRFLSCVVHLGFCFFFVRGNHLLAIPPQILLNFFLLNRLDGSRLGASIATASDEAGNPKRKDERNSTPPAARTIIDRHAPGSLHQVLLFSY